MDVTEEALKATLAKVVKEPEFKGYSFSLGNKDLLSEMDGSIPTMITEDAVPWKVSIHVNDENRTVFTYFEVKARNPMNEDEFEAFVRAKASGAIQEKIKS